MTGPSPSHVIQTLLYTWELLCVLSFILDACDSDPFRHICISIIYMSARIQAEFLRLDRALRGGCSHRSSLKAGSSQAWEACEDSLLAVVSVFDEDTCIFKSDKSVAAVWVQWRKSNTSKQLLGLVRSVLEAATAQGSRREASAPDRMCMALTAVGMHDSITIADRLHAAAAEGVLWPALHEWLLEKGGVDTMWRALTLELERACAGDEGGIWAGMSDALEIANARANMILDSVVTVLILSLSLRCPKPPPQPNGALLKGHGGDGVTVLQLTLGKLIPAAFPAMQPEVRTMATAFAHRIGSLCRHTPTRGSEYLEPMHLPALRAWPYLVGAARHQISLSAQDSTERRGLQVGGRT